MATTAARVPSREHVEVSGVLDDGARIFRSGLLPLVPVVLAATVPGLLALGWGYASLETGPVVDIDVPRYIRTLALSVLGFMVFQGALEPLLWAVIYDAAESTARDGRSSAVGALRRTVARFGAIFAVGALYLAGVYGLVALAALGAVGVGGAGFVVASGRVAFGLSLAAFGGLTAIASVVVSGWFALRYSLALPHVVVSTREPALSSFARSAQMMNGAYLSVGIVAVVLMAIRFGLTMVAASFVSPPNLRPLDVDALFEALPVLVRTQIVQQTIATVVGALFSIYAGACWVSVYRRRQAALAAPSGAESTNEIAG